MTNNENGRSMVEMLGVLAIIGVLSAGGLAGYSKAMFKHKLNSTMEQITMLVTNIRTAYGQQKDYTGLNNGKAVRLGIVPPVMGTGTADNASLTNPFKGNVVIGTDAARKGDTNTAFTVTYDALPKEACIALATADFGSGAGSGFIGVVVDGDTGVGNAGTEAAPVLDLFIGSGASKTALDETTNKDKTETARTEGQAYSTAGAITACKEQAKITWKFY